MDGSGSSGGGGGVGGGSTELCVSILGAGPAGFALAADLESSGTRTLIYSHPAHMRHAQAVRQRGHLRVEGVVEGVVDVAVTTDMAEAVAFSSILVLAVPSIAQESILEQLRPHDLRLHTLIAVPGNLFGLVVGASGVRPGNVLETNLSPYSCRMTPDGTLLVYGKKRCIFISALHNRDIKGSSGSMTDSSVTLADVLPRPELIQAVFPGVRLKWCSSVVEVCLDNVNGVFHPLMLLMNAGRIEDTAGDFFLYRDGLTPAVASAMEAVDRVRIGIGAALGLRLRSSVDVSNECYDQRYADFVDLARRSPPHNRLRAPANIANRNITEDVPDLLVAWHGLAVKLGVDASPITAIIVLVEMSTGINYADSGRNLSKLQLHDVSREELVARFGPLPPSPSPSSPALLQTRLPLVQKHQQQHL